MLNINKNFNNHLIAILKNAIFLASNNEKILKPKHIFIALLHQKGCIASHLLKKINYDIKEEIILNPKKIKEINISSLNISLEAKKIIEKATLIAAIYHHKYIGTEHLLAGILELNDPYIMGLITKSKIDINYLKNKLRAIFENISNFPAFYPDESNDYIEMPELNKEISLESPSPKNKKKSYLNNFCTDLTDENFQKSINPIIGREQEIKRLIQILSRRNKNNPILLGEAGVGKTAIIEGLAKKITAGEVPTPLLNKRILSLDINSLVAGTAYRGEFETRLKNLIAELSHNENVIIFIDEIHNIIGAGSTTGTLDVANILKPILTKGNIKFIGATTFNEFKKHIEKDPALERRFQPIIIKEPTIIESIQILEGIKENYENFHNVNIASDAIETAVKLSKRYIQDRLLPDKAIDLLDETAAKYKLEKDNNASGHKLKKMEEKLQKILKEKEKNVMEEKFDIAIKYKNEETKIRDEITQLKNRDSGKFGQITRQDIYKMISEIVNIPEKDIENEDFKSSIANLNLKLKNKIVGQDEAIGKIINILGRSFAGVSAANRPLGTFLFLGPSGVGKTELVKVLGESLFNTSKSLIKIDMSEYSESFNISKLIGSPAGYIGFEEGGVLTEKIRRNPYSIILFDKIEKAHKSLFNLLLQILEEGEITDASGNLINFKNSIIIMTSNLGAEQLTKQTDIGFEISQQQQENFNEQLKNKIREKAYDFWQIEFLSRIDEILIFNPLNLEDIKNIISLNLNELAERLKENNIYISFNKKIVNYLTKKSISYNQGARPIKKIIQENIEGLLAEKIINQEIKSGDKIHLTKNNGEGITTYKIETDIIKLNKCTKY